MTTGAKIKVGKKDPNFVAPENWYDYALFLKCIRGDKTDNIFSAYPGVREKGSSKTIGIREAYEDRHTKGYNWNNFMNQTWIDHNEVEHKVKDRFALNETLIDLTKIPDEVKASGLEIIAEATGRKNVSAPRS